MILRLVFNDQVVLVNCPYDDHDHIDRYEGDIIIRKVLLDLARNSGKCDNLKSVVSDACYNLQSTILNNTENVSFDNITSTDLNYLLNELMPKLKDPLMCALKNTVRFRLEKCLQYANPSDCIIDYIAFKLSECLNDFIDYLKLDNIIQAELDK